MNFSHWAWACALSGCLFLGDAMAQGLRQPFSVKPAGFDYNRYLADDASSPSDQPAPVVDATEAAQPAPMVDTASGDFGCTTSCCEPSCCNTGCNGGCGSGLLDCCLGDAYSLGTTLFGEDCAWSAGGWTQISYTSESTGLFNTDPDQVNLQQQWFYLERTADGSEGWDWGFRADLMYGTDADDTNAFGNTVDNNGNPRGYDTGWTHGIYGWALPQLYAEVARGDLTVKAGHFFTLIGYEVVTAPDNFFYSHAYTMYNSEPFTHTGVLASYSLNDNVELHGGWTAGWDTGFDQFEDGSNFLGGVSLTVTDDVDVIFMTTIGDFGFRGDEGYMHSVVVDTDLTEKFNYIFHSDYLRVESTGEDNFSINQYFLYTINDCLAIGNRTEWWKTDPLFVGAGPQGNISFYETTFGVNYKPHANLIVRPEIRYDWSPAIDFDETIFGIDAIATY